MADLRDTFVGDSVISAFSFTEKLTELYLECPNPETRQHQVDEPPLQQQRIIHVHLQQGQAVVQNENDMVKIQIIQINYIINNSLKLII